MVLGKFFSQFSLRALGKRFVKRFGGTLKRRFLRQNFQRRFSRFEHLEDRSLMAVTPSFSSGQLLITLDAASDALTITGTGAGSTIQLAVGSNTVYNPPTPPQANPNLFTNVTSIVVQDGGSAAGQSVTFNNQGANRIDITGQISVSGIETVVFDNTQTIGAASLNIAATTGGTIQFNGALASDTIDTTGTQTYANTVITQGDVGLTTGPATTGVSLLDAVLNKGTLTITNSGTIAGGITGNGGVTKAGAGTLTFTGTATNGYQGLTTVSGGELDLNKTTQAVGGDILINGSTATLKLLASNQIIDSSTVTVATGTFDYNTTALRDAVGSLVVSGGTVLGRNATMDVNGDLLLNSGILSSTTGTLSVAGNWLNNGGTFLHNNGRVAFTGTTLQSFRSGGSTFNDIFHPTIGTLKLLDTVSLIGTFTNSAGTLDINGLTLSLTNFVLQGGTVISSVAGGKLTSPNPFDLQAGTIGAILTGAAGINKTGPGTVILSGVNTYTGPTTVTNGTLVINGSVASNVTVNGLGVLNGSGTVNGNVTGTGTFSPGGLNSTGSSTPGVMHITGTFAPTGIVQFEINSPYMIAGTDYDQYIVDGGVNLSGATASVVNNNDATPPLNNALLTLINNTSGTPTVPSSNPPDNSTIFVGSRLFNVQYNGGSDGNNVVLIAITPQVSVTVSPSSVSEVGSNSLIYTFSRDIPAGSLAIRFFVSGNATLGSDYTASSPDAGFTFSGSSGTITFASGNPTATVVLTPIKDTRVEPNETVTLTVVPGTIYRTAPSPANMATGTITDNSITGVIYRDVHGILLTDPPDGARQPDEPGIPNVFVYLDLNNDGKISITEPGAITDNYGRYTIPNVSVGNYTLREVIPPSLGGFVSEPLTPDGSYQVNVPEGPLGNLNFGHDLSNANDFGDAPDSYGTTLASNGARAGVMSNFHLGVEPEFGEPDAKAPLNGSGDITGGINEEQGVQMVVGGTAVPFQALAQGGTSTLAIVATNGSHPAGKLQAWVDFNGNGTFDSTEKVISNLVLSQAVTLKTISIPSTAVNGPTFARFRYGYENDLGPTGPSQAGEVEDYQIFILPGNGAPTAVADVFPQDNPAELQSQGVIKPTSTNYLLDVLGNDIGGVNTFGGPLTIENVTPQAGAGTLTPVFNAALNRYVLSYTPGPGVQGGSDQTFIYQAKDALGNLSNFVTDTIHIALANSIAIDDTFTLNSNINPALPTTATGLPAMANDLTPYPLIPQQVTDKRPQIIAVGLPDASDAVNDTNGVPLVPPPAGQTTVVYTQLSTGLTATLTIDPVNPQTVDVTAEAGFLGTALFKYEIDEDPLNDDPNTGPSTRLLTVQVTDGGINASSTQLVAAHYLAELDTSVVTADGGGNPTDTTTTILHAGDTFFLRVQAADLRTSTPGNVTPGVQAAFLDMLLNPAASGASFRQFAQPVPNDQNNPMSAIVFDTSNGYSINQNGQNGVNGAPQAPEFNEVGASRQVDTGLGAGLATVFYVKMQALMPTPLVGGQRQTLTVAGDPADGATTRVLVTTDNPAVNNPQLTDDQVFLRPAIFSIHAAGEAEFTNAANPTDVDVDGVVSASDVLTVINTINAGGSRSLVGLMPTATSAMIDVNADSLVTSIDALMVINFINSFRANRTSLSSAQGEAGSSTTDTSLLLSSPIEVQSSGPATTSTPTLLTTDTTSASSSSTTTPTSTSSASTSATSTTTQTQTTGSTSPSTTVDSAAADDYYANLSLQQQLLKRFGR